MRTLRTLAFVMLLFSTLDFCSYGQTSKLLQNFPASSPEQQGINSSVLDGMMLFIKNTNQNIHHLTIIRNNHTVLDADIYPYSSQYLHDLASVRGNSIKTTMEETSNSIKINIASSFL